MTDESKQVNDLVMIPRWVAFWARMVADREGYGEISLALGQALAGPPIEECRVYADDISVRAYRGAKSIRVGINDVCVLFGHDVVAAEEFCIVARDKRLTVGDADTLLAKSPGRTEFREFCGLPPVEGEPEIQPYEIEAMGHGYGEGQRLGVKTPLDEGRAARVEFCRRMVKQYRERMEAAK